MIPMKKALLFHVQTIEARKNTVPAIFEGDSSITYRQGVKLYLKDDAIDESSLTRLVSNRKRSCS